MLPVFVQSNVQFVGFNLRRFVPLIYRIQTGIDVRRWFCNE